MALKIELKPGEKFVINGAVVTAGRSGASLVLHNKAVLLRGRDVMQEEEASTPARRLLQGMGYLSEDRKGEGLALNLSIADNITLTRFSSCARWGWLDLARQRHLAQRLIETLSIKARSARQPVSTLSGGNQQKALFARALASDARVILMDDPMRGVDIGTKLEVYDLIREEAKAGRTFLWYTTEMDELAHCDHVYVFRGGAIVASVFFVVAVALSGVLPLWLDEIIQLKVARIEAPAAFVTALQNQPGASPIGYFLQKELLQATGYSARLARLQHDTADCNGLGTADGGFDRGARVQQCVRAGDDHVRLGNGGTSPDRHNGRAQQQDQEGGSKAAHDHSPANP